MKRGYTRHLWGCRVRHEDMRSRITGTPLMVSTLLLEVAQPNSETPSIERALAAAKRFVGRNRKRFAISTIQALEYRGDIDN